ncbi:uncharacterized protein G2W53_039187 [Senna tora]|uniref:Uncharacterized protein n=1 Tax=Senna tora TaxID=362788 RepID=A0A834SPJ5_9FABA|nr:uncharacterized protein G2W53_039187 [Senna tora]
MKKTTPALATRLNCDSEDLIELSRVRFEGYMDIPFSLSLSHLMPHGKLYSIPTVFKPTKQLHARIIVNFGLLSSSSFASSYAQCEILPMRERVSQTILHTHLPSRHAVKLCSIGKNLCCCRKVERCREGQKYGK